MVQSGIQHYLTSTFRLYNPVSNSEPKRAVSPEFLILEFSEHTQISSIHSYFRSTSCLESFGTQDTENHHVQLLFSLASISRLLIWSTVELSSSQPLCCSKKRYQSKIVQAPLPNQCSYGEISTRDVMTKQARQTIKFRYE
jgi:hypothetical protein